MLTGSVHETSLDLLYRYILVHGLRAGDALPPLSDLAAEFGVSVASMREAVRSLEASGVLTIRHGVGMFLQAYDFGPILRNLSFSALFDDRMSEHVLQTRQALETGGVAFAVNRLTTDELDVLEATLSDMQSPETSLAAEYRFHSLLMKCLDNPFLAGLFRYCWLAHQQFVGDVPSEDRRPHYAVHVELQEALRNRDRLGAEASLARYFDLLSGELRVTS